MATTEELRDLFIQLIDHDRREGISAESTADGVIAFAKLGRDKVLGISAERDRYRSAWLSARRRADTRTTAQALAAQRHTTGRVWDEYGLMKTRAETAEAERDQLRAQLAAAGLLPVPQPPGAQELLCSLDLIRTFQGQSRTHHGHTWETQPGAPLVWCPGAPDPADLTTRPCPRQCEHDPHTWPAEHPTYRCSGDLTYTTTKEA